jgi:hypothetical protein
LNRDPSIWAHFQTVIKPGLTQVALFHLIPVPSYDHLGFSLCIASLHSHRFTFFQVLFTIFSTIFFLCSMELLALFINLSCLLCGAVSSLHQLVLFVACSCPFLFINFLVTFELSTKVFFLINLSCLLCGAIHFSSSTSLSSLSYQPRYSFLFMILLVGRLVCLFIFVKIYFYMVQIIITIYLSCNFSKYFQFFFSYNFISSTNIHCIFYFFFCFFNSCTLH